MTTEIRFYHLQKQTPMQALVLLVERALQKKEPIRIQAKDKTEMELISAHLWAYQAESFLPHDTEDSASAETQPVLVAAGADNKNNATLMFQIHDGMIEIPADISLCCKIFDGGDDAQISAARAEWKRLKDFGATLSYWQQDENGKWEKKA